MQVTKRKIGEVEIDLDDTRFRANIKFRRSLAYWIGSFVMEFNALDSLITSLLSYRVNFFEPDYVILFLTNTRFMQKIEFLEKHYQYVLCDWYNNVADRTEYPKYKEDADHIIAELKELGNTRNVIAHSDYYSMSQDRHIVFKVKFDKGIVEEHWVEVTKPLLIETIKKTNDLYAALLKFDRAIGRAIIKAA